MTGSVFYEELSVQEFKARLDDAPIAYLPLGTLEYHSLHLPLGTDGIISRGFLAELAERVGGIVMPPVYVGPDRSKAVGGKMLYGKDICVDEAEDHRYPDQQLPGSAYWIEDGPFESLMESILAQLRRAGFRVVVTHGHLPSTKSFRSKIDEWSSRFGLTLLTCARGDESDGFGIQTDHAGANETSLMLALCPRLVNLKRLAVYKATWPVGVSGRDPRKHASARLGRKAIRAQVKRMAKELERILGRLQSEELGHAKRATSCVQES